MLPNMLQYQEYLGMAGQLMVKLPMQLTMKVLGRRGSDFPRILDLDTCLR